MFEKIGFGLIVVLVLFGAFSSLYAKNQHLKNEVLQISIERDNLKSAYQSKKLEADNSKESQKTLESLIVKEKEASQKLEDELEILRNEPTTEDGDVAPLLKRSLERMSDDNH